MKSRSKWASSLPMPQEADGCMEDMGAADGNAEEQSRHLKRGGAAECSDGGMAARRMDRAGRKSGGGTKWISGAIKHPGALHKELHVPEGEKIPEKKLEKASHSDNPTLRKRANLAKTLKKMH